MVRAEDKTIECLVCGSKVVLSGYNTTICPSCGTSNYEFDQGMLVLKDWIDRLKTEGKNPEDYYDDLIRQIRISELGTKKIVSLSEWRDVSSC